MARWSNCIAPLLVTWIITHHTTHRASHWADTTNAHPHGPCNRQYLGYPSLCRFSHLRLATSLGITVSLPTPSLPSHRYPDSKNGRITGLIVHLISNSAPRLTFFNDPFPGRFHWYRLCQKYLWLIIWALRKVLSFYHCTPGPIRLLGIAKPNIIGIRHILVSLFSLKFAACYLRCCKESFDEANMIFGWNEYHSLASRCTKAAWHTWANADVSSVFLWDHFIQVI